MVYTWDDLSPKAKEVYEFLSQKDLGDDIIRDILDELQGYLGFLDGGSE